MASNKLTKDKVELAEKLIANGATRPFIAKELGVCPGTVYLWERQGRENKSKLYRSFYDALWRGEATATQKALQKLQEAATEGLNNTKKITVEDAAGDIVEKKVQASNAQQLKAIIWQLEHRYGFNNNTAREKERLLNGLLSIARKSLSEQSYWDFLDGVRNTRIGEELEIEDWLLLNEGEQEI